jgi:L-amino acid N-acyltransferase YncA
VGLFLFVASDSAVRSRPDATEHRVPPMPQTLVVRPATTADVPAITAIYRPAVLNGTASFEIAPPDEAETRRRMEAVVGAGFPYLAAERAGVVAGYGYLGAYRPRPAYAWSVENSIYVDPAAQRSGVGRALLSALIEIATARGCRQMIAVIGDSGQRGSIGLHRAAGFTFCGTVHAVGFKNGRWLDQVLMQRALGPGDSTPPT